MHSFDDYSLFDNEYERTLYDAYAEVVSQRYESYEANLDALFGLKSKLDSFFDNVMVNADDVTVKNNRKALIGSIYKSLLSIADIKEISV